MLTFPLIARLVFDLGVPLLASPSDNIQWATLSRPLNPGLPQSVPFKYYTPLIYNFGEVGEEEEEITDLDAKKEEAHWVEFEFGDTKIGYPKGRSRINIDFASGTAWGLFYWGKTLDQYEWREHGEQFINMALLTPEDAPFASWAFDTTQKKFVKITSESSQSAPYWFAKWLEKWPDSEQGFELAERVFSCLDHAKTALVSGIDPMEKLRAIRFIGFVAGAKKIEAETVKKAKAIIEDVSLPMMESAVDLDSILTHLELSLGLENRSNIAKLSNQLASMQSLKRSATHSTFGLIGTSVSQSSDAGHMLLAAGAVLDDKGLFERGVHAIRWGLNTLCEPTLAANGIHVLGDIKLGQTVDPTNWKETLAESFERGEGALLLGFAQSQNSFGGLYQDSAGWKVGIDGCEVSKSGAPVSILSSNPKPFGGEHTVTFVKESGERREVPVVILPSIAKIVAELDGTSRKIIAVPGFLPVTSLRGVPSGVFSQKGSKWSSVAKVGPKGLETNWPAGVKQGSFSFKGIISGQEVEFGPVVLKRP